jgi:hypothetical protein
MRRAIVALLLFLLALGAARGQEGRWEGLVRIPGRELPVVVDLAPVPAGGWTGSIILPGLDIKGAQLANIAATPSEVGFEIANLRRSAARRSAHSSKTGGSVNSSWGATHATSR